ncbi:MAG: Methylenetetrahydrofolate--tRNA-(uracil-5-)-methyltransferase TrmFO [Anaerolinea thermophila]|uniref:Methylenetetrahydrofolate--tRNA-(uracil-5-)-methyltransferase TrmFO n=1 Tax=Anaerolinea thermophila TaxID=167964 RepID=A0A101FWS7_9CHLR|nr:MAG: Methylenetetrahydrofolate--tRNA-(uracil-5-)-methyltransferase TrmFO [Anaerolinea thermophila]
MRLTIVGGGLAGCEAALQAAERGIGVDLYEMRPEQTTGAHRTGNLAELVCSNSLGSNLPNRASGLLKEELRRLGSLLIACGDASSLPAGGALAVDRDAFSSCVQAKIENHPNIRLIREEITDIPKAPAVLASGPLTSPKLLKALQEFSGKKQLFFYDAIAPIVHFDSINMKVAYWANRYDPEDSPDGDYINCPLNQEAYHRFREALISSKRIPLKDFEVEIEKGVDAGSGQYFQGCQPIEVIAATGEKSLAFGPMRPAGLTNPRTGRWPYAVVQLRQDNLAADLYNIVGFQTNLFFSEQERVFRLIPGLENASFERYGQMHRNAYITSPSLLDESLAFKQKPGFFAAGQLSGIEGYAGNIASGLVVGINAARFIRGLAPLKLPITTMTGALMHYISHAEAKDFQPMKAMFGLLPKPEDDQRRSKRDRYLFYSQRALAELEQYLLAVEGF